MLGNAEKQKAGLWDCLGRGPSRYRFHGDIRLVADEGKYQEYVARFTHGTFEWIRPMAEVPRFIRPAYGTIIDS